MNTCALYMADEAQARQARRAQESRPKLVTVDDLFMDLEAVKAAEDLQQEEQMGWWQQDEPQEWHQPSREGGEVRVDWTQQQTNEFASSRTGHPQQGEWHRPEGRKQEARRSDPPHPRGSNKRSRQSKKGRRNM